MSFFLPCAFPPFILETSATACSTSASDVEGAFPLICSIWFSKMLNISLGHFCLSLACLLKKKKVSFYPQLLFFLSISEYILLFISSNSWFICICLSASLSLLLVLSASQIWHTKPLSYHQSGRLSTGRSQNDYLDMILILNQTSILCILLLCLCLTISWAFSCSDSSLSTLFIYYHQLIKQFLLEQIFFFFM